MTLESYTYNHRNTPVAVRLTRCPACSHRFTDGEHRWRHFLEDHDPDDFGLSPLGETRTGHDRPLFTPLAEIPE